VGVNSVGGLYAFAVIFGLAYGSIVTQLILVAGDLFGLYSVGAIVGLEMLGTSLGGAIGPILGGYVFDMTKSYHFAFLIGAIILLVAIILIVFLKTPSKKPGAVVLPT
jgi:MFS family permease